MYHGVGQSSATLPSITLDACRDSMCTDPRCWNTFKDQCGEWMRTQLLLGCLESNCADPTCRDAFPDECRRGAPMPTTEEKKTSGFSGTTVLLLGVTTLAVGLWLGRRKNA